MQKLIIFNGGREGSLLIGDKGTRSIPPFTSPVIRQLRGISELVQSIHMDERVDRDERSLYKYVTRIASIAMEEVESIIGPLEGQYSLVYQDEDGGFTCGSTGKPPIPIPWPPEKFPSVGDLVSNGLIEQEMLTFIDAATDNKFSLNEILEEPEQIAKRVGVPLSEKAVNDLRKIAPSQADKFKDREDREVVDFIHKVIEDGRYLDSWMVKPYEAARSLGVQLSDKAYERILAGSAGTGLGKVGSVASPAIAVVVAVVVMLVPTEAGITQLSVFDRSGLNKF